MIKIGIDFSIISPAICIFKDNRYHFISFFDDYGENWKEGKSKKFKYHRLLTDCIELCPYTRKIDKSNYRIEQDTKMKSAKEIANMIVHRLKEIAGNEETIIGLEGFSYGSISSSTLDLVLYNSFLRIKLMEEFGDDCIVIVSPTEGKKTLSGKGNAKKEDQIKSFIDNRTKDEFIEKNELWKHLNEMKDMDFKNIKPVDDLCDAYAVLRSI